MKKIVKNVSLDLSSNLIIILLIIFVILVGVYIYKGDDKESFQVTTNAPQPANPPSQSLPNVSPLIDINTARNLQQKFLEADGSIKQFKNNLISLDDPNNTKGLTGNEILKKRGDLIESIRKTEIEKDQYRREIDKLLKKVIDIMANTNSSQEQIDNAIKIKDYIQTIFIESFTNQENFGCMGQCTL